MDKGNWDSINAFINNLFFSKVIILIILDEVVTFAPTFLHTISKCMLKFSFVSILVPNYFFPNFIP